MTINFNGHFVAYKKLSVGACRLKGIHRRT